MLLVNKSQNDKTVVERLDVPKGAWNRMRGLLGRSGLDADQGMLLTRCRWVHTLGMRFTIDIVFLSREGEVVDLQAGLKPNRFSRFCMAARDTLELPNGAILRNGLRQGDRLEIQ